MSTCLRAATGAKEGAREGASRASAPGDRAPGGDASTPHRTPPASGRPSSESSPQHRFSPGTGLLHPGAAAGVPAPRIRVLTPLEVLCSPSSWVPATGSLGRAGPWLWSGPAPGVVAIWGVIQWVAGVCFSLSLPSPIALGFCLSKKCFKGKTHYEHHFLKMPAS